MGYRTAMASIALWGALAGGHAFTAASAQEDERLANDLPVPMSDSKAVEAGRERYGERCAFCHGGGGKGAKGPCLTCGHFKHGGKASQLLGTISGGVQGTQMGAFASSLSREEILSIIAFLRVRTEERRQAGELD
jgi:mono/diheme cytochrome c family protein